MYYLRNEVKDVKREVTTMIEKEIINSDGITDNVIEFALFAFGILEKAGYNGNFTEFFNHIAKDKEIKWK